MPPSWRNSKDTIDWQDPINWSNPFWNNLRAAFSFPQQFMGGLRIHELVQKKDLEVRDQSANTAWVHDQIRPGGTGAFANDGVGRANTFDNIEHGIGTGSFTITAWIYPRSTTGASSGHNGYFSLGNFTPGLYWTTSGGNWQMYLGGFRDSGETVSQGEWSHLVALRDSNDINTVRFYKNGIKTSGEVTNVTNSALASSSVTIGAGAAVGSSKTDGLFDEVNLFQRALSHDEIIYHYEETQRGGGDLYNHWSRRKYFVEPTPPAGRTTKNTRSHPLGVAAGVNWRVTGRRGFR